MISLQVTRYIAKIDRDTDRHTDIHTVTIEFKHSTIFLPALQLLHNLQECSDCSTRLHQHHHLMKFITRCCAACRSRAWTLADARMRTRTEKQSHSHMHVLTDRSAVTRMLIRNLIVISPGNSLLTSTEWAPGENCYRNETITAVSCIFRRLEGMVEQCLLTLGLVDSKPELSSKLNLDQTAVLLN